MLTRNIAHLDRLIVDNLHKIRAIPFDVVVHCPRSGTIPASLIATYLSRPLCSVEEYIRWIISLRKSETERTDRILLVDDSINTGGQMQDFIKQIKQGRPDTEIFTLSAYSTKTDRDFQPDLVLDEHPECEYIYSWFMWKTKRISLCAVDMDGVLCADCPKEMDDDGEKYLKFLKRAPLKFKPLKHKIGAIVTSRLEKYRPQTERWLKRRGIKYGKLIMGQWESKDERKGKQAQYKADFYSNSPYLLFIESSEKEALEIARITGKAVWCVDTGKAY